MNNRQKHAMNTLPVITYRWLKLNDITLDIPLDNNVVPYTKEYLIYDKEESIDNKNLSIIKTKDLNTEKIGHLELIKNESSYGVSTDMVKECESSYNSGIYVEVAANKNLNEPIMIKYSLDQDNPSVIDYNLIYAKKGSRFTIVIDYSTDDLSETYHNGLMKVYAEEDSHVTIVKIQRMNDSSHHFDSNIAYVDPHATVNFIQLELGSMHSVTNYINNIEEAGEATIDSIYFGDGKRIIDLSYLMNHIGRRSISKIQTKGALKDQAVKTFRGTIDFKKGAGQSDGSEEEYVILLDKGVKSHAIPLLLCSEDDVKGQHAASAGKVDQNKLFYMMSRGFSKEEAMKMIVEASFQPVIDKIPTANLRDIISKEIHRRIIDEKV